MNKHDILLAAAWAAASVTAVAGGGATAAAQQNIGGGFSVTGSGSVVSDYRFRGISLTNEDPALQATVNLNHSSGLYVGTWASSLADTPLYGRAEVDLYAGYTHGVAPHTNVDVGLLYYFYPGNDRAAGKSDYFEPYASISRTIGPVTAKIGAAYAWDQGSATAQGDNLYVYGEASGTVPHTPVSLTAHLGHSSGTFSPGGDYLEWRLGAEAAFGRLAVGLAYVDTDLPEGPNVGATVVGTARLSF